jgi:hypothetical protein
MVMPPQLYVFILQELSGCLTQLITSPGMYFCQPPTRAKTHPHGCITAITIPFPCPTISVGDTRQNVTMSVRGACTCLPLCPFNGVMPSPSSPLGQHAPCPCPPVHDVLAPVLVIGRQYSRGPLTRARRRPTHFLTRMLPSSGGHSGSSVVSQRTLLVGFCQRQHPSGATPPGHIPWPHPLPGRT